MGGFIPVSYTHLDVYKRQGLHGTPRESTDLRLITNRHTPNLQNPLNQYKPGTGNVGETIED